MSSSFKFVLGRKGRIRPWVSTLRKDDAQTKSASMNWRMDSHRKVSLAKALSASRGRVVMFMEEDYKLQVVARLLMFE